MIVTFQTNRRQEHHRTQICKKIINSSDQGHIEDVINKRNLNIVEKEL